MKNELFSIGPLTIHGYGLMIGIGFLLCVFMAVGRAKKYGLKPDAIIDIALWGIVCGFLGAKILYVIVEFPSFLRNPMGVLGSEGFVVYGGIIAGVLAGLVYCRVKKLKFLQYFDLAAPSIALAQGCGRIGCFLAGCCYGRETECWLGVVFPEGSLAPAGVKLLPAQLIMAAGDFLIVWILILYHRKNKIVGNVGALYMLLYGVGRFAVEWLRSDDRGTVGSLSTSQAISIVIILGAFLLFLRNKRSRKEITKDQGQEEKKNMSEKVFYVTYPWDENGYKPEVEYHLSADEEGFCMHIIAKETDPLRKNTQHQSRVCLDSCVEWFVNFMPEACDRYFNMEVNANGAMYAAFRKDRYDFVLLKEEEIETMDIQAKVNEDTREVSYRIPFALIQKYIPDYEFQADRIMRGNFYKCGDLMEFPHYGMWHEFEIEKPDYHRPEFFGEFTL